MNDKINPATAIGAIALTVIVASGLFVYFFTGHFGTPPPPISMKVSGDAKSRALPGGSTGGPNSAGHMGGSTGLNYGGMTAPPPR
jgi:hypothetical protein